jgi:uncharacterized tellurite resistance protein B-like protein
MIESLKSLFMSQPEEDPAALEHRLRLAAAALLIEVSRADYTVDSAELRTIKMVLQTALGISQQEIDELVALAGKAADKATSLYEFTRLINDHYSREQKLQVIQSMWRIAYADDSLDKYEERLIRQVSDLIHVPHKDYIRLKVAASNGDQADRA